MNIIRQGDVILIPRATLPQGATIIPDEGHRIVLMHGEATGHAHAIYYSPEEIVDTAIRKAQMYAHGGSRFLKVKERVTLAHEEHSPHVVPPGIYEIPVQVDMTLERMPRRVAD